MHRRASAWLAEQGLVQEAVLHAQAAGDREQVARLIETGLEERLSREDWSAVDGWLRSLPRELVWEQPGLLLAHAWTIFLRSRFEALPPVLEQIEALLARGELSLEPSALDAIRGTIECLRNFLAFARFDPPGALQHARAADQLLPARCLFARSHVAAFTAMTRQLAGDGAAAKQWLEDQLGAEREPHPAYRARLLIALAYAHLANADFWKLEQTTRQLLALAELHQLPVSQACGLTAVCVLRRGTVAAVWVCCTALARCAPKVR